MFEKLIAWLGARYAVPLLVVLSLSLGALFTGLSYEVKINRLKANVAHERQTWAEAKADADRQAVIRLKLAQDRGDELTRQLSAAKARRIKIAKEKDYEIAKRTSGQPCLDADLVSLLNGDRADVPRLPATAGLAAPADSAPATDRHGATDQDIALWAREARDRHDTCRERIDALRDWFSEVRVQGSGIRYQNRAVDP
jgi:hypothetical protein